MEKQPISLDIQGYEQLDDTTDLLIITKSLKGCNDT